jgi:hypothetical protein
MDIRLVGIEGKDAQVAQSSQKLLKYFCFGNLGFRSREILPLDCLINFMSMDRYVPWCRNTYFDITRTNTENRDFDLVPDYEALIFFSRED